MTRIADRGARAGLAAAALAALLAANAAAGTLTPHPPHRAKSLKSLLAYERDGEARLLSLAPEIPAEREWILQPYLSRDWGKTWSKQLPDGTPLAPIPAFAPGQPLRGTTRVDWADGHLLRISDGNARYSPALPPGTILYSTRLNTDSTELGTIYRIVVFASKDDGATWTMLPAAATSARDRDERGEPAVVGLWSNCLFERSDGTIQIYYDNERIAWDRGRRREQWLTMRELSPGDAPAWGEERVVVSRPGARAGMPSVSEGPVDGVPTLFLTVEDVEHYRSPQGERLAEGVVRIYRTTPADRGRGHAWAEVATFSSPDRSNFLAPYHLRSRVTGELLLVFRSDLDRASDAPQYRPGLRLKDAADTGNPSYIVSQCYAYRDGGSNGREWEPFETPDGRRYLPGGRALTHDPTIFELPRSADRSELLIVWGEFASGFRPRVADLVPRTWVQRLTLEK